MSIQVLNNVSSLLAENAVSNTQASQQSTLQQLSTGLKINSGADDAAGLSIADGLGANIAALTQSGQNASNGIGLLQTADGALSQVTTQLNRAVTLATEASNGGLTTSQSQAANTEFQSILNEINQIGQTTNFNGTSVFSGTTPSVTSNIYANSTQTSLTSNSLFTGGGSVSIADATTGQTFTYSTTATSTIGDLQTAVQGAVAAGTLSAGTVVDFNSRGQLVIGTSTPGDEDVVTSTDTALTEPGAAATLSTDLTKGSVTTISDSATGGTFKFTAGAASTLTNLNTSIAAAITAGTLSAGTAASINGAGQLVISTTTSGDSLSVASNDPLLAGFNATGSTGNAATVYTSDGSVSGSAALTTNISALSASALGLGGANTDLLTTANAQSALDAITSAINQVAAQRGSIGAGVNQLTADTNVETTQVQNLTSAQNNVQNANIASTTANLTQYSVLEQTGFAALSQSQQAEQNVLKLLQ
jgi:flagellin